MSELKHDKWVGTTYGNGWMHRWLIRFLRVIDVRMLYGFAYVFVVPPTMIVNSKARKVIYKYFRERLGYSPLKSFWKTFQNHCVFSQVVIDRFAMYAGKQFNIEIEGYDTFERLSKQPTGFVQLSSHIGNYEIAGYSLVAKDKRFNALVFAGEKESVMANRNKMFDGNNIRMIPMKADMSHLFVIDTALTNGEILSMPADRVFGSQKAFKIDFMGKPAKFPQGPFILAAMRETPVLFVAVMKKRSKTYQITVKQLDAPSDVKGRKRAEALAKQYARELESTVRENPTQWYNYFDFWAE